MKIIIVGLGKVGQVLAQALASENHDLIVIDLDKDKVNNVVNYFDVTPEFLIGKDSLLKKKQDLTSREIFDNMSLSQRHEIAELCQEWLLSLPYN